MALQPSPKMPPAAAPTKAAPPTKAVPRAASQSLSSLPADAFDMDDNDMEWTQLLDADTEFLKEVSSLQTMGKTLPSTRPEASPPRRSPAPPVKPHPKTPVLSSEEEEEARVAAMTPAKPQGISLEDIWTKVKIPVLALGGVAAAGGAIALFLSPVVQRPLTVTSLRFGWTKDVQGRNLVGVNLQKLNLAGVNFANADLRDANLAAANLSRSNLMGANLRGTNLQKANLRGARVRGSQIELNKDKKVTQLDSEDLLLWSLSNTNRPGRAVTRQNLDGFNLAEATLSRVNFSGSRLTWVDFTGTDLSGSNFSNTTLTGANFQGANLRGARFTGATWDNRPNFAPRTNQATTCPNGRPGPCTLR
ncbi:MAG: pentapeptide repeat-containing protein, partial [Pseudanabaenaceae cyanobacterium]